MAHTVCRACVHVMVDWAKHAFPLKLSPSPPGPAGRGSTALAHAICDFVRLGRSRTVRNECVHHMGGRAKHADASPLKLSPSQLGPGGRDIIASSACNMRLLEDNKGSYCTLRVCASYVRSS